MTKYATPVQTRRFLIMIVSLLSCINNLAQGQPPNDIYNELSLPNPSKDQLPSSNSDSLHLSSDEAGNPRLQDLLLLKQSLSEVLSKVPELDDKDYENEDHPEETKQTKRVFCNGFTGCGGRFRGRRRQQQPVEEIGKRRLPNFGKRPFCNSYGCFNSGKKGLISFPSKIKHHT
uniref:Uncharacterized protein n=1 Tax=Arion vulgaris TaxID=1028688 RepID=A0A0B7A201_9EUPU